MFLDDSFLKPTLADDAVLFSLDDIEEAVFNMEGLAIHGSTETATSSETRIASLEAQLRESQETIEKLRGVGQRLLEFQGDSLATTKNREQSPTAEDSSYFKSYAFRG